MQQTGSIAAITIPAEPLRPSVSRQEGITLHAASAAIVGSSWWSNERAIQALGGMLFGMTALTARSVGELRSSPIPATIAPLHPAQYGHERPRQIGHRHTELHFLGTHPREFYPFVGQWVVLEGETIVAHGTDPVSVIADAKRKGIQVPYIFYVEPPDSGVVNIGL